jgi:RecA/RadA recombinase
MHKLNKLARQNRVAVVVTNQVQSYQNRYTGKKFTPVGGNVMAYTSKHRVHLSYFHRINKFQAELDISYCYPLSVTAFKINEKGLTDTEDYGECASFSGDIFS